MARKSNMQDFLDNFNAVYGTTRKVKQDMELAGIANAKPEQSQGYTAEHGAQLEAAANAGADIGVKYKDDGTFDTYTVTFKQSDSQTGAPAQPQTIAMQGVTDFLGKRSVGSMSEAQVNSAKLAASAGVLEKHGDTLSGLRLRAAAAETLDAERKRQDEQALRAALQPTRANSAAGSISTGPDIIGASNVLGFGDPAAGTNAVLPTSAPSQPREPAVQDFDSYLKNVAPSVLKTLVTQASLSKPNSFRALSIQTMARLTPVLGPMAFGACLWATPKALSACSRSCTTRKCSPMATR
jgi:hypothetical protein